MDDVVYVVGEESGIGCVGCMVVEIFRRGCEVFVDVVDEFFDECILCVEVI